MKGCLVEMNVDYPGDGTGAFDLAIVPKTRSAEACAEMCGASDMCQSWTYIKKPSHAHFQNCVLKKQFKPNREESDCCVSGTPCARKPKLACPEGYHEGGDCTRAGQCCTATKTADCGEVCLRVSCEADNGVYEKPFTCMIRASEQFTLGAPGTTCASEGLVIKDEAECERAVAMLGHTTGWWKGTLSSIPSGCSIDHVNGPHFNRVISGVGTERADLRPICRVPSSTNLPTCYQAVEMDYTHTMGPKRKLAAFRSAEECGQACGATPLCRSWTYVSDKGDSRYRDCYLGESIATTGVKSTCCTSGAACQDLRGHQGPPSSVTLDKLSFLLGEEIKISFTKQSTVKAVGKIAIYAPNDVESAAAPTSSALWLYTCGTQKCTNEISSGSVTFGSSTNAANTQTWPLGPGAYQIVLMSHDSKIEARSKEFVVHPDHKNFNLQGAATSRRRVDLENAGKDCWVPCNKQSGACTFCGSGRCCKKGLGDGGCSELEGGDGFHTCVAGFGWQTPLPGAISCGNARTFHGKNVGLLPCQLLCQRDPFCRSIYGALDSGDRSCWTCPEYTPRKARRLGDGEETDNKKSSLETDYKSIEFKRESRWAFKTFRGAKTCPEGFEDLNEKECTEVAAAVITASGGAQIVKNNAASKGCTLPTSPTTDEGARPTWSENTNRFEKTDTGLVCKLVIPTDGLVSFNRNHFKKALVEGSGAQQDGARCADGDLTTFCVTSTTGNALGHVEIEFKQPLNVMRVWIANRGDSKVLKLGRFDVLVESEGMNNDRIWVYCVRRQEVNMRSQWNEVICDEAIRGKKVKIMQSARSKADEFHISDVRVQGITDCTANIPRSFGVGAAGTTCPSEALVIKDEAECERAVAMLGHSIGWWKGTLSSMPSGCSINHVNGPHFNRNLSGVGTARADLRPICRVPKPHNPNPQYTHYPRAYSCHDDAIWQEQTCVNSRSACLDEAKEECEKKKQCWGYAIRRNTASSEFIYKLYDARAVDDLKCDGPDGLRANPHWDTYQRIRKQISDVIVFDRPCWTYDYKNDVFKTTNCHPGQLIFAEAMVEHFRQARTCYDPNMSPKTRERCMTRQAWRQQVGEETYSIFMRMHTTTITECPNMRALSSRRLDLEGLAEKIRTDLAAQSVEEIPPPLASEDRPSATANRRRLSSTSPSQQCREQAADTNSRACNLLKEAAQKSVNLYQDQVALARDQQAANRVAAQNDRAAGILSGISSFLPLMSPMGKGDRNVRGIAGRAGDAFGFAGDTVNMVASELDKKAQARFAEEEIQLLRREGDIQAMRDMSDRVQVCDQHSTHDLLCQMKEFEKTIDIHFNRVMRVSSENHLRIMKELEEQNEVLERQSLTTTSILNAVERTLAKVKLLQNLENHGEILKRIENTRTLYTHYINPVTQHDTLENIASSKVEWCHWMKAVGHRETLKSIVDWVLSDAFLETTRPHPDRRPDETGVLTKCELTKWMQEYTEAHRSLQVLLTFAASINSYYNDFKEDSQLERYRVEIATTYTARIKQLKQLESSTATRCVNDQYSCPSGMQKTHGQGRVANPRDKGIEPVTRKPCEKVDCTCRFGHGTAKDCSALEGGSCTSCNNGYKLENGKCRRSRPKCANGVPEVQNTDGHDGKEHCATCNPGYHLEQRNDNSRSHKICVENKCHCKDGSGLQGLKCPKHNPNGQNGQENHCGSCSSGKSMASFEGTNGIETFCLKQHYGFMLYSERNFHGQPSVVEQFGHGDLGPLGTAFPSVLVLPGWCMSYEGQASHGHYCNCAPSEVDANMVIGFDNVPASFKTIKRHRCGHPEVKWLSPRSSTGKFWTNDSPDKKAAIHLKSRVPSSLASKTPRTL